VHPDRLGDSFAAGQPGPDELVLVQAAGEYLDHVRRAHSWESRLNRSLIRPEPLKHRALKLVREITAA
jgi:uncharacterized C2H2 Zn-finger protein